MGKVLVFFAVWYDFIVGDDWRVAPPTRNPVCTARSHPVKWFSACAQHSFRMMA
jgi:hypothetical protein